jgi:hypothetical protein
MKNTFEKPVSPEEGTKLFAKMKKAVEDLPEDISGPNTGAAAMHEWQKEKEEKDDEQYQRRAA